jgi:hypothetical protein
MSRETRCSHIGIENNLKNIANQILWLDLCTNIWVIDQCYSWLITLSTRTQQRRESVIADCHVVERNVMQCRKGLGRARQVLVAQRGASAEMSDERWAEEERIGGQREMCRRVNERWAEMDEKVVCGGGVSVC